MPYKSHPSPGSMCLFTIYCTYNTHWRLHDTHSTYIYKTLRLHSTINIMPLKYYNYIYWLQTVRIRISAVHWEGLGQYHNTHFSTYSFNNLITDTAVPASNPVVGSSRNIIPGEMINSIPILVRFFWPPDIPLISSVPTCESDTYLVLCS